MKLFTSLMVFVAFLQINTFSFSQDIPEKYSKIKVFTTHNEIQNIVNLGVLVDENISLETDGIVLEISEKEVEILKQNGYSYTVLIADMADFYKQRNENDTLIDVNTKEVFAYTTPVNFPYGSMGNFLTLDQIYTELDKMVSLYPNLITAKKQIGTKTSVEGRPIYYVKISDNPNIEEPQEPDAFFNALHHAREPAGMTSIIFYMYYLLENYNTNDSIKFLVDNTELFFIPCVNVDGYKYNETTNPSGGGTWRKNRKNNGGSYGVDINRNYSYQWSPGNVTTPSSDSYGGTAAFSEPETQIMRDFFIAHKFEYSISYHCYSNLMIHPWCYTSTNGQYQTPDHAYFQTAGGLLTAENNYNVGTVYMTLGYTGTGGSCDWAYGEQTTKNKIIEYAPEVGSSSDGFWPTKSRIVPLCQQNMYMNLLATQFSHKAIVKDLSPVSIQNKQGNFNFNIKRVCVDPATFYVKIVPLDNWIQTIGDSVTFTGMTSFQQSAGTIAYTLNPTITNGQEFSYNLVFRVGDYLISRTIKKTYNETTSISDLLDSYSFNITPNPVSKEATFYLNYPSSKNKIELAIYNSVGQKAYSSSLTPDNAKFTLDVSKWENGIYYCVINSNGNIKTYKKLLVFN